MKVAHSEQHVLGTGNLDTPQAFQIRTSAHAFKILSSGLYSDKIGAVLREIGCNARDAHIAQGIAQKPFTVKLPNAIDNQFYIRDHGTGMGHIDVKSLYTTYFASTKQDSNDYTGAFGLGSKSPFSYTDSFTVTACHAGVKRIYTAHIGNTGIPLVALMDEAPAPADWPTGIEVGFPVKRDDIPQFAEKAQEVFQHFTPLPKIEGGKQISALKVKEDFNTYAFISDGELAADINVTMGCVRYPLDSNEIREGTRNSLVDKALDFDGLLLRFDVGDLQIVASREKLQYDDGTKAKIRKMLHVVVKDMLKQLRAAYDKALAGTWADMCQFVSLRKSIMRGLSLNSDTLTAAGYPDETFHKACENHAFKLPDLPKGPAYLAIMEQNHSAAHFQLKINLPTSATGKTWVDYRTDLHIVQGAAKRGYARIRQGVRDGTLKGAILAVLPNIKDGGTQADVDKILGYVKQCFKGVPITDVGTLPAPPLIKLSKKKGTPLPDVDVELDGKSAKLSDVPKDRQVYVQYTTKHSWGNSRHEWWTDKEHKISDYDKDKIVSRIAELNKDMPACGLVRPVEISKLNFIRARMRLRPEWVSFKDHAFEKMSDAKSLAHLAKACDSQKCTIDLKTRGNNAGLLENLVHIKHNFAGPYAKAEAVLRKAGLWDMVNKVHEDSTKVQGKRQYSYSHTYEPDLLTAFRGIASDMHLDIKTPEFKMATLDPSNEFSFANDISYDVLAVIAGRASRMFPKFMKAILDQGKGEDE